MPTSPIDVPLAPRPRRGYSREFSREPLDPGASYMLDGIPSDLWRAGLTRAHLEGLSMRTVLLRALAAYAAGTLTLDGPALPANPIQRRKLGSFLE